MFFGFNTSVRGLLASQRGLYNVNHNIDNLATPGYSRQYIEQRATRPRHLPGTGYLGTGTEIHNIGRHRDFFVDYKYWNESSVMGQWSIKSAGLNEIQTIMDEPSDSSFRQYLDDFYLSMENMSKNPGDTSFRQPVRENALSMAKHINETAKRLENLRKDSLEDLEIKVDEINTLADQIVKLNRQIYIEEVDGHQANDLRDQRELLVDRMSQLANIQVRESEDGSYDISIMGSSIVNNTYSNKIQVNRQEIEDYREALSDINQDPNLSADEKNEALDQARDRFFKKFLSWENGYSVGIDSGEIRGHLDMFMGDGKDNSYRGLVFYEDQLNHFARGFADKFNEQHRQGYSLEGRQGIDFFVYDADLGPASSLGLSEDILGSLDNIAASKGPEGNKEDQGNLLLLIGQREDRDFFNEEGYPKGRPDDFIKSMISSMAVDCLQADRFVETEKVLLLNLENKRKSISGVSLNDEMTNMVRYQQVYKSASSMINTLDELLDLTVNRLGMVGR